MRRLAVVGVLLASCTLAAAQESPGQGEPAKSGNWFTRMFSWGSTPEPKKADDKAKREPAAKGDSAAAVRAREEAVLNRRNDVIWKLREIATRTQDDALLRKADELFDRANTLYMQRTGGLALEETAALPARPLPKGPATAVGSVHTVESDEPGGKR